MRIDDPTAEDRLGFEPYVKGIEDLITGTEPDDLPLTLGIYGAWGSGKSSFMMQLQKRLMAEEVPCVWFDAWKYDRVEDVRSALIYKILNDLYFASDRGTKSAITRSVKNLAKVFISLAKQAHFSPSVVGIGGISLPSPQEIQSNIADWRDFQAAVDKFACEFKKAVQAFLVFKSKQKLVIFIDDLDRCLPENVIVVLEALKLFLTVSPCVFVIGIDRVVIEKAVQAHYGTELGLSREYLDKIIQYSFNVPPASPIALRDLLEELIPSQIANETCLRVFNMAAQGNPRIYLRLLTAWKLVIALAAQVTPNLLRGDSKQVLALSMTMLIRFPTFHDICKNNPIGLWFFLETILKPLSTSADEHLRKHNSQEYVPFLDDGHVRQFLKGVFPNWETVDGFLGNNSDTERKRVKEAFNLSTSVA